MCDQDTFSTCPAKKDETRMQLAEDKGWSTAATAIIQSCVDTPTAENKKATRLGGFNVLI